MDEVKHKCPNCGPDGIAHTELGIRRGLVPSDKYAKLEKECDAWKRLAMAHETFQKEWQESEGSSDESYELWMTVENAKQSLRDLGVME